MVPQTRTLKGSILTKAEIPWKASGIKMQPEKMVLKEKNKKGSFLMKLRCRTDLLASIFPSCILVYFLPIFLSSAGLFVGFLKNMFQRTDAAIPTTPADIPMMTHTNTKCSSFSTQYSNRKQTFCMLCQVPAIFRKNWFW